MKLKKIKKEDYIKEISIAMSSITTEQLEKLMIISLFYRYSDSKDLLTKEQIETMKFQILRILKERQLV